MFSKKTKYVSGFTLTEIVVTIIIVGVLASLALPRFTGVLERVRAAEGVQILTALLGAQKVHAAENNGDYSAVLNDLDISIDRAENFNIATITVQNNVANVAQIQRTGGYTLSIDEDGTISCVDGGITCAKAGF
ncbi:MAG: prepilin-type N-terminal cleavage/methylation domain-containing protein [Candidatus Omnitrophica bacterium]|nr:prepilin-type N-terminal cleavage/methylation domain-containing protein [Candidatus Omnitrophota bacterium]